MEDIADEPKTVKRKNRKEKKDKKKSRSGRSRSRLGGCGGRKQYSRSGNDVMGMGGAVDRGCCGGANPFGTMSAAELGAGLEEPIMAEDAQEASVKKSADLKDNKLAFGVDDDENPQQGLEGIPNAKRAKADPSAPKPKGGMFSWTNCCAGREGEADES